MFLLLAHKPMKGTCASFDGVECRRVSLFLHHDLFYVALHLPDLCEPREGGGGGGGLEHTGVRLGVRRVRRTTYGLEVDRKSCQLNVDGDEPDVLARRHGSGFRQDSGRSADSVTVDRLANFPRLA